ncbi:CidA/LrgA family protein [Clostridium sp. Cult3]|uniref:CidA/LrgA family protein n=1 Tax=Clostridium sp. Cult3 TaxID=2079004 RepID=UPI001F3E58F6|nr:CidA/LrgA family protein [Clostridium sp. Cult3]
METLKQFSLILIILFWGQIIQQKADIPIPGTVLGMVILLILLMARIIKVERVEKITKILLEHLILFFVPAGIGIITVLDKIEDIWIPLLIILFISTMVVMIVTGLTIQILNKYTANKSRKGA